MSGENDSGVIDAGITIPGEEKPAEITLKFEEAARAKGWRSEEEYEGEETGFIGAEEFLKREPLFDKIKSQSKELKRLNKTVEAMTTQFSTQVKAQVQLRLKELQQQKKDAIRIGDIETVEQIDAEIDQQKVAAATVSKTELAPELSEWLDENTWFTSDKELETFTITHNKQYMLSHPDATISESLDASKKAVIRAYPEKAELFGKPKAAVKEVVDDPPPSPDGGGEPKGKGKKGFAVSRLSPDQKIVYDQMVTRNKVLTHDDYFKGLDEIGELA